jgi:hypothetical protein
LCWCGMKIYQCCCCWQCYSLVLLWSPARP